MGFETTHQTPPTKIKKVREWGDDPLGHYVKKYPGVPIGKLRLINYPLVSALQEKGLLQYLPKSSQRFKGMSGEEVVALAKKLFPGMPRDHIRKNDKSLYQVLANKKVLHQIPLAEKPWGDDPLGYCEKTRVRQHDIS